MEGNQRLQTEKQEVKWQHVFSVGSMQRSTVVEFVNIYFSAANSKGSFDWMPFWSLWVGAKTDEKPKQKNIKVSRRGNKQLGNTKSHILADKVSEFRELMATDMRVKMPRTDTISPAPMQTTLNLKRAWKISIKTWGKRSVLNSERSGISAFKGPHKHWDRQSWKLSS